MTTASARHLRSPRRPIEAGKQEDAHHHVGRGLRTSTRPLMPRCGWPRSWRGPILLNRRGARMDRHCATRRLRRLGGLDPAFGQQLLNVTVGQGVAQVPADRHMITSDGNRNPANPDCGGHTRPGRRRILPPCPSPSSVNATDPLRSALRPWLVRAGASGAELGRQQLAAAVRCCCSAVG